MIYSARMHKLNKPAFLFVFFILLPPLAITGCGNKEANRQEASVHCKDCNIILIVVDTLRADRLPCYGYSESTAPNICSIAAEGVLFENAFSQAPHSGLSFESMMASSYGYAIIAKFISLPEVLKIYNYSTVAISSNDHLNDKWKKAIFNECYILSNLRGWIESDRTGDVKSYVANASIVTSTALNWLKAHKHEKVFMYLNYMDTHNPEINSENSDYDEALIYADTEIKNLISRIKKEDMLENSIIIITSDHGEGLGDHNWQGHGLSLYEEQLHVPLIIRYPQGKPARVKPIVRLLDIMPTLLEFIGAVIPSSAEGVSLLPLIEGKQQLQELPAYSMTDYKNVTAALRYGKMKYIATFAQNRIDLLNTINGSYSQFDVVNEEFYNLTADPGEQDNIIACPLAATYRESLLQWFNSTARRLNWQYTNGGWKVHTNPYPDTYFKR